MTHQRNLLIRNVDVCLQALMVVAKQNRFKIENVAFLNPINICYSVHYLSNVSKQKC